MNSAGSSDAPGISRTESPVERPFAAAADRRKSLRRRLILRHFLKNREGATAVEFALVALPFFGIIFAIIEVALTFWATQVLENAVADASRQIYTGQFQTSGGQSAEAFRDEVCSRVTALFNCNDLVEIDVRSFPNFPGATLPPPVDDDGEFDASDFGYQPTGPDDIVVVRAAMAYPAFVGILGKRETQLSGGRRLIMATSAFRNEPFTQ
ncbi:MAG: pilus assembly protein [Salinarimonas sp.]|nr:pilus assembly protein [Salinarimonas sp.]